MALKTYTCANFPAGSASCPYTETGEEDWVIEQAVDHLMAEHGSEDNPQLREDIKASLVDAPGG